MFADMSVKTSVMLARYLHQLFMTSAYRHHVNTFCHLTDNSDVQQTIVTDVHLSVCQSVTRQRMQCVR